MSGRHAEELAACSSGFQAAHQWQRVERRIPDRKMVPGGLLQKVNPTSNVTARGVTKCVPLNVERKL